MADCEEVNLTNATTTIPIETLGFILAVKILVGATCLLSILGASLIILTYVAFRDLRTTARQLLVNLSVADILIAASHFVGLLTNYERLLNLKTDTWCSVQAAVTMYGTISSFLWTIAVGLYMFTVIVIKRPDIARKMVPVYYLVCWGVPVVFPVLFGIKGYLGFELPADIGWCYLRYVPGIDEVKPNSSCNFTVTGPNRLQNVVAEMLGYDIWLYIAFIVLPLLYIPMHCYLRCKVAKKRHSSHSVLSAVVRADLKLIFVPLIFLLLRIWSFVVDIPAFYMSGDMWEWFRSTWTAAILTLLSGIGVSGQGLANAILFCIFTKQVRHKILKALKSLCYPCYNHSPQWQPMSSTDHNEKHEETTVFEPTDHGGLTSTLEYSYDHSLRQLDVSEGEQALLRASAHFNEIYGSSIPEKIA